MVENRVEYIRKSKEQCSATAVAVARRTSVSTTGAVSAARRPQGNGRGNFPRAEVYDREISGKACNRVLR